MISRSALFLHFPVKIPSVSLIKPTTTYYKFSIINILKRKPKMSLLILKTSNSNTRKTAVLIGEDVIIFK